MNITAAKFFDAQRTALQERHELVTSEIAALNERLTEARREASLLDDVIQRFDAHLLVPSAALDTPIRRTAGER